ncbi:ribonuclease P protein component [candidate division GN15 bacterium]|uniref:Ribonuclease P protein component n=1 Tax=candidate division GN15 bacterium TaxID=2072418 RepID=A0A855X4J9_9BACT|nr:MAG: ribonuclease P protein component [candidate division GN15 bacterium]
MAARYWRAAGPRVENGSPSALAAKNKLPRSLTLKSRVEISRLIKTGRRIHGPLCTLVWEPADSFAYGIFISGKIGPAHDRNRIKRHVREAVRLSRRELTLKAAFLPKADAVTASGGALRADVDQLLDRVRDQI